VLWSNPKTGYTISKTRVLDANQPLIIKRQFELARNFFHSFMVCPEHGIFRQYGCSKQVDINLTNPHSHQFISFDKVQSLWRGDR